MKKRLRRKLWKGEFAEASAHRPNSMVSRQRFEEWRGRMIKKYGLKTTPKGQKND